MRKCIVCRWLLDEILGFWLRECLKQLLYCSFYHLTIIVLRDGCDNDLWQRNYVKLKAEMGMRYQKFANINIFSMSSIIDNVDKNKHRTVVRVILYSKVYVKIFEVKDFQFSFRKLKHSCNERSNRFVMLPVYKTLMLFKKMPLLHNVSSFDSRFDWIFHHSVKTHYNQIIYDLLYPWKYLVFDAVFIWDNIIKLE